LAPRASTGFFYCRIGGLPSDARSTGNWVIPQSNPAIESAQSIGQSHPAMP